MLIIEKGGGTEGTWKVVFYRYFTILVSLNGNKAKIIK